MPDTVSEVFTRALSGGYVTNRVLEGKVDAFARQRTSEPFNVFDTQNQYSASPLYWDSIIATGGSASAADMWDRRPRSRASRRSTSRGW